MEHFFYLVTDQDGNTYINLACEAGCSSIYIGSDMLHKVVNTDNFFEDVDDCFLPHDAVQKVATLELMGVEEC